MFGTVSAGLVRAPYASDGRKNATSWLKVIRNIADKSKYLRPIDFSGDCWMSKTTQIKLTLSGGGGGVTKLTKSILTVRFLAFLQNPTDENWTILCNDDALSNHPFDHICGRGQQRRDQNGYVCINGILHGTFSDRQANEARKKCTNGARCLCPGHGQQPATKCFFVHADGQRKRCRNHDDHVAFPCTCKPESCY